MSKINSPQLKWLVKRLATKNKIKPEITEKVLCAISELRWDWKDSKYDIYGLQLEENLVALGVELCPKNLKKERL